MIGSFQGKDEYGLFLGSGINDNDICIETSEVGRFDVFQLMSTAGALDVFVTLDGTNYSTAISLSDLGATTLDPVVVTVAGRLYGFAGKFKAIRVLQNGGTAAVNVALACGHF